MSWDTSPWIRFLLSAAAAVIAGGLVAARVSVGEGAAVLVAVLAAGALHAITVHFRQRHARREPLLSIWDFVGVPILFVLVASLAYGVAESWGVPLVLGAVVAVLDVVADAGARRQFANPAGA